MDLIVVVIVCVMVYLVVRVLHLATPCVPPVLHFTNSPFNHALIQACPLLQEPYVPPLLWGKSGHIQTVVYGKLGRVKSPFPKGQRCSTVMADGATSTFDIFEPLVPHPSGNDYTLLICPGLANSSQSVYICTCVHYAQNSGYRVAVLNHLGALPDVPLTAPRIFTYGGTEEYGAMVMEMQRRYPDSAGLGVGFSMGANIVLKYLGETDKSQHKLLAAISLCQGYDAESAYPLYMGWENFRRGYNYFMTRHQTSTLQRHQHILFSSEAKEKYGSFDQEKIFAATTLACFDELYSSKRAGFQSRSDYYVDASCIHYLNKINIPLLLVNAHDDPIVPTTLLEPAKQFSESRDNVVMAVTAHGGHLGFFEGSSWAPDTLTWIDKIVVQYSDAVLQTLREGIAKPMEEKSDSETSDLKGHTRLHGRTAGEASL